MRVAFFARYSSRMQDDLSIDAQVAEMDAFAAKQGWEVVERYLLPETRSSELDRSTEYCRMLDDAKAKKWQVLLCHKLDRLGRDRDMVVLFKATVRRLGIEIRSVVENLSDSMEHRMLEGMFELFADYYAKNLGQETRKGHRQLVRQGCWKGGPVAWGLTTEERNTGGKKSHKHLVACPVRGPILVEVFQRVAAGETPELVRRWVANKVGEEQWTPQTFYARIKNPVYHGRIEYGRTSFGPGRPRKKLGPEELVVGEWEGLVSKELWDAANSAIESRRRSHARKPRATAPGETYRLSGLVRCRDCGSSIIGGRSCGHRRYRCSNRKCGNSSIRADHLEPLILGEVLDFMSGVDEAALCKRINEELNPVRDASAGEEVQLRKRLSEIKVRRGRLLDAIEQGADASAFHGRLAELKAEEAELAEQIALCQLKGDARAEWSLGEFVELWQGLKADLPDSPDIDDLRILMQHGFEVEFSIKNEEGQLFLKLAPAGTESKRGLVYGRSARI